MDSSLPRALHDAMSTRLGDGWLTGEGRRLYGGDDSRRWAMPSAVALPRTREDVVALVRACREHRVPLVARWSGRVAAGATHAQPVCLTDLFATVAELAGAPLPAAAAEDSFSFAGALLGRPPATPSRRALINHSNPGEFAYREGPWKLVLRNQDTLAKSRGQPRIQELYNLEADRAETTDVAASNPAVVRHLRAALEAAVAAGSLRGVPGAANDTLVRVDITQERRWAAPSR